MSLRVFIAFLLIHFCCGQVDGEFWWLNDKFANYVGVKPSLPQFETLSEHDNDENAKIIFRDDNLLTNSFEVTESDRPSKTDKEKAIDVNRYSIIKWPADDTVYSVSDQHFAETAPNPVDTGDKFVFKFLESDDTFVWKDRFNKTESESNFNNKTSNSSSAVLSNDKVSFNMHYEEKLSENICTYMKKIDCENRGIINYDMKDVKKRNNNQKLICCILPLKTKNEDAPLKTHFLDTSKKIKRLKRSENVAQRQRDILLQRKHSHQSHKSKPEIHTKIATPDYEYDDPYWNIKNLKNPNKEKQESNTRYDYNTDDYIEDYAVELPKPGLTGLYSDNEKRPSVWTFSNQNKGSAYGGTDDYDDSDSGFGYSTIDPRFGSDTSRKSRPRGKPVKLTTLSEESSYDAESQTISYQSNPNFNVLQDFKLLNLLRDKSRPKFSRSTTTESFSDNDSKELSVPFDASDETTNDDFEDRQIYKGCGKTAKPIILKKGKQIGDTENGSHPWLALLVRTRQLNNVLCYASLIHPRAAISTADCVHGSSSGEITLIAGIWNLNERTRSKPRVVQTLLHPKYKNGGLNNNLAILHWKRPLKLALNVQPVCLANPHSNDECMLVGWGGFDQAIRPRSRWQRASVNTCKDSLSLNGVNIPSEAFCASVQSRSTVTGIGGSLICNVNGHLSAVGVAISRDSTLVMLPVYDWVTEVIGVIQE